MRREESLSVLIAAPTQAPIATHVTIITEMAAMLRCNDVLDLFLTDVMFPRALSFLAWSIHACV